MKLAIFLFKVALWAGIISAGIILMYVFPQHRRVVQLASIHAPKLSDASDVLSSPLSSTLEDNIADNQPSQFV